MSHVSTNPTIHQYEGDNALWCYIGEHTYELSRCKYCNRKQHMIDLPLPNEKTGQPQQRLTRRQR